MGELWGTFVMDDGVIFTRGYRSVCAVHQCSVLTQLHKTRTNKRPCEQLDSVLIYTHTHTHFTWNGRFSGGYWRGISEYSDLVAFQRSAVWCVTLLFLVLINLARPEARDVIVLFPVALQQQHDKTSSCDLPRFCTARSASIAD